MGLDIYAHRIKSELAKENNIDVHSDYEAIMRPLKEEAKAFFVKETETMLADMRVYYEGYDAQGYKDEYMRFIQRLRKTFPIYDNYFWKLRVFGYDEDNNIITSVKNPDELGAIFKDELEHWYAYEDAYFRKVNFIYAYFSKFDNFADECVVVTKDDIGTFLAICKDVDSHCGDSDYANEVLPTQSGFFFGSTNYDNWYWSDVKNCISQMTQLYESLGKEDLVLWVFSW